MRDFPSCFGENAVQIADSSSSSSSSSSAFNNSKTAQNVVTCIYQCRLRSRTCILTVTWSKSLMAQSLSVAVDDSATHSLCKVDLKWLFSKRKGSKPIQVDDSRTLDLYWDLTNAKFGSGPEPLEGFYLAVVFERQMLLLLGDMRKESLKKTAPSLAAAPHEAAVLLAKRENMFGKKLFFTRAQFCDSGKFHDLVVECDTLTTADPCLIIRVDRKTLLQVKRLRWKFRGNHTVTIDGLPVEVFWDVHNWLFTTSSLGNAVFMFKTCISADKLWAATHTQPLVPDPTTNFQHWSHSQRFRDSCSHQTLGFSLILNAWKQE